MTAERIRRRVFIPLSLAMAVLMAGFALTVRHFGKNHVEETLSNQIQAVDGLFQKELKEDTQLMSGLMDLLEKNDELQEAWLARDRETLLQAATPLFEQIRSKHRVTHFYFVAPDRTCFLRVHNPPRHGDVIDRQTMDLAKQTQTEASGIELGKYGTFTLRVVRPWKINGQLVGYLELGEEIGHVISELKEILDVELLVLIRKSLLNRADWEEGQRIMGRACDWRQFDKVAASNRTLDTVPLEVGRHVHPTHTRHEDVTVDTPSVGEQYRGRFVQLLDVGGNDVGDLFVLADTTEDMAAVSTPMNRFGLLAVVVACLFGGLFWWYLGRVERRLVAAGDSLRAEIGQRVTKQAALKQTETLLRKEIDRRQDVESDLEDQSITTGRAGSMRKAPKRGRCHGLM